MKVLAEKEIRDNCLWQLVKFGKNCYGFGRQGSFDTIWGLPVSQCGTKEEIINSCKTAMELCEQNIRIYKRKIRIGKSYGWRMLIKQEKTEFEMYRDFIKALMA